MSHEEELAKQLEGNLLRYLATAELAVILPDTPGGALISRQTTDTASTYDPTREIFTITATVKIEICKRPKS